MTNYVVTTRNKAGALEERAYTAENRADLFKQLAADGITAVRIAEGVPGKKPRKASSGGGAKIPHKTVGLVAASLVAFIAAVVIIMSLTRGEGTNMPDGEEKELDSAASLKQGEPKEGDDVVLPSGLDGTGVGLDQSQNPTNNLSQREKPEKKELPPQNVSTVGVIRVNGIPITPRRLFKTRTENYIADLMTVEPGEMVLGVGLPPDFDKEFMASYATPITFDPEDTEEDKEIKRAMKQLKEDMLARIKGGETPSGIILEERKALQRLHDYRQTMLVEVGRLKREGATEDEIEDTIEAANKLLDEQGAKRLLSPRAVRERLRNLRANQNNGGL